MLLNLIQEMQSEGLLLYLDPGILHISSSVEAHRTLAPPCSNIFVDLTQRLDNGWPPHPIYCTDTPIWYIAKGNIAVGAPHKDARWPAYARDWAMKPRIKRFGR